MGGGGGNSFENLILTRSPAPSLTHSLPKLPYRKTQRESFISSFLTLPTNKSRGFFFSPLFFYFRLSVSGVLLFTMLFE